MFLRTAAHGRAGCRRASLTKPTGEEPRPRLHCQPSAWYAAAPALGKVYLSEDHEDAVQDSEGSLYSPLGHAHSQNDSTHPFWSMLSRLDLMRTHGIGTPYGLRPEGA